MVDPVKATGTDAEKSLAFQNAYGALKRRIEAFTSLPVESLDRIALQSAVDDIARTPSEEIT
jgi:arsenate reductase